MNTISSPLHVNDLVSMRNIIDVALSRGAFNGSEIGSVSEVYTKLTSFIDSIAQSVEAEGQLDESAEGSEELTDGQIDEAGE